MYDNPDILNLHFLIRASYIFVIMSGRRVAEDRSAIAVAHLAHARSQSSGTGILGDMSFFLLPFIVFTVWKNKGIIKLQNEEKC